MEINNLIYIFSKKSVPDSVGMGYSHALQLSYWVALKTLAGFQETKFSGEFILMASVVFVFSQIFKKGVEIQYFRKSGFNIPQSFNPKNG
jgi:hypothetical protein